MDLTGGKPGYLGTLDAAMPVYWEDLVSVKRFPLDTDRFLMQQRVNLLSTYAGEREYTTERGAWGEPLTEEWRVRYGPTLTTVREITAWMTDPSSENGEEREIKLPSGEALTIIAADGVSHADFVRRDGSLVRIYVETEDYPHTINGVDERECFETLYYAG